MKIIDLYIGKSFTRCFLLVLSILGFLFSFFEFILELDEVGKGHYQLKDALFFCASHTAGPDTGPDTAQQPPGRDHRPWSAGGQK